MFLQQHAVPYWNLKSGLVSAIHLLMLVIVLLCIFNRENTKIEDSGIWQLWKEPVSWSFLYIYVFYAN